MAMTGNEGNIKCHKCIAVAMIASIKMPGNGKVCGEGESPVLQLTG